MKKFSKKHILTSVIKIVCGYFFLIFFFLIENEFKFNDKETKEGLLFCIISFIVMLISSSIYFLLFVNQSKYELRDDYIYCIRGVLVKKESRLDYKKIHSANINQSFFQKIFKTATLHIDSGSSNTSESGEIIIHEDYSVANEILKTIEARREGKVKEETKQELNYVYYYDAKNIFINNLLSFAHFIFLLPLIIIGFVINLIFNGKIDVALPLVIMILIAIVIVFIFTYVFHLIKYYNYEVVVSKDKVSISYGFFSTNTNEFEISKIKAIDVNENIFERIFKLAKISLNVVGLTDDKNAFANSLFIPLIKLENVQEVIDYLNPQYEFTTKFDYTSKKLTPYLVFNILTTSITIVVGGVIVYSIIPNYLVLVASLGLIILISLMIIILSAYAKCLQGLNVYDDYVAISSGILVRRISFISNKNIIGIEVITTKNRCKQNIYSYDFHFYGNMINNNIMVYNLEGLVNIEENLYL